MPRRVQYSAFQSADLELVTLFKQTVKLAAVTGKLSAGIERLAEGVLHYGDHGTDTCFATQCLMQIGSRREVIGVNVGFQYPLDLQAVVFNVGDNVIGRAHIGTAAGVVEVEYGVDNGAGL